MTKSSSEKNNLWQVFSVMPHRMFFAAGCVYLLLPMLWWAYYLYQNSFVEGIQTLLPAAQVHAVFMVYGMITQFILGFALTVFPRWLQTAAIKKGLFQTLFFSINGGFLIYLIGFWAGRSFFIAGIALVLLGFTTASIIFLKILLTSKHPDKFQTWFICLAFMGGTVGIFSYLLHLIFEGKIIFYLITYGLGVYFYIPLLLLSVSYRMLPFFTSMVVKNYTVRRVPLVLVAWGFFSGLKALFFVFQFPEGYILSDGGLLVATLVQFYKWDFFRSKKVWLLKFLYFSMAWFPMANLLFIAEGFEAILTGYTNPFLETAGLHSLTVGFTSTLIFAMVTRVTLGHSGRILATGPFETSLYFVIQAAAISRVGMELARLIDPGWVRYIFISALIWLFGFLIWAFKYFPIYFKPRIDGNPG